jgi:D-alanine-D-alanine ligase
LPHRRVDRLQVELAKLLPRLRLAVIHGGDKAIENAVINPSGNPRSWKSYRSVALDIANAMLRLGCGHVTVMPDDMRLGQRLRDERVHIAWLNTGGVQGHCSIAHAAAMLEMLGIPYVGHDPLAAATLDNKHFFKRQLVALGIPTAPFMVWHPQQGPANPATHPRFLAMVPHCEDGFIVKPVSGRASLHVHYVERARDIAAVAHGVATATRNHVLIEKFLPGGEYCIAVCGSLIARRGRLEQLRSPFAFASVERVLAEDEFVFTSMDVKPITTQRVRLLTTGTDLPVVTALEDLANNLYCEFPLRTLVRLDVRADNRGKLYVLEANPKPDLKMPDKSATSLICAGLASYAMSYDDLILSIFADRMAGLLSEPDPSADHITRLIGG